jgi:16S rRNA (guanine(527)-N(7))-methyltransferase RsmG
MTESEKLNRYVKLLLQYNQKVNLISRKITDEGLQQLLMETEFLYTYVSGNIPVIVDAGSGNGLLGIPIAMANKNIRMVLVEPRKKKAEFLQWVKDEMELENVDVFRCSIEEYLKLKKKERRVVIARGFPDLTVFCRYIKKKMILEAVLITSDNKIKKNHEELESVKNKIYNVPLRENLKILKMEKAVGDKNEKK